MSYILLTWLLAPIWWPISLFRKQLNSKPKRILILEIAGIGDVICSTHLFKQLRETFPVAQIDLVVDPIANTLAPALSVINQVIPFAYAKQRGFMGRLRLARLCLGYDTAICLIPSAAQITGFCWAAMPRRLSVLPLPLNTSYFLLAPLLTSKSLHQPGSDFLETQSRLFKRLGLARLNTTKRFEAVTNPGAMPKLDRGSQHIGLLVGSGRTLKRVPLAKLTSLVAQLVQHGGRPVQVLLIGGPGDVGLAAQIKGDVPASLMDKVLDLSGQYPLADLPGILNQLDLLIGVDSGVTHMADALGVPILCIAGPVDLAEVYSPATAKRLFVVTPLPCYPCSRVFDTPATCHQGTVACLTTLDPSSVAQKAIEMLDMNQREAER